MRLSYKGEKASEKKGQSTLDVHKNTGHTFRPNIRRLVCVSLNGVCQTHRQAGRVGDWATQSALPGSTHPNSASLRRSALRANGHVAIQKLKTCRRRGHRCIFLFPEMQRGIPESVTVRFSLLLCKMYFFRSGFFLRPDFSPVFGSVWLEAVQRRSCRHCGPITQGLCLQGGSIVNLLRLTLRCRSPPSNNRLLANFCPDAICGDPK